MALVQKQAAILVKDAEAKTSLMETAMNLMNNESEKATLSNNIKKMAVTDAAERIVKEILAIAN
jgi:UDP-N-acetylglucosamine--N-acetylmuramyl-(pentapeptide) pyrophosphoryl-undecaprenol N-acetylglucosamine transferase